VIFSLAFERSGAPKPTVSDAFLPFFVDEWGRPGQRVELTLEGLGPDDIGRLDCVAVG
jgi:hypothetical protein